MENEEKMMTGEESLNIITDMISRTKMNVRQSSFHLLFWGWLILFCNLLEYILMKFTSYPKPWNVWWLVIAGILVSMIYGFATGRKQHVHTYAEKVYLWTWMGFAAVAGGMFIFLQDNQYLIPPFILLLAGMPTFISGFIFKFKPLILGGISFWFMSIVTFYASPSFAPLAGSIAMLTGYLIPGYLLKYKDNNDTV